MCLITDLGTVPSSSEWYKHYTFSLVNFMVFMDGARGDPGEGATFPDGGGAQFYIPR